MVILPIAFEEYWNIIDVPSSSYIEATGRGDVINNGQGNWKIETLDDLDASDTATDSFTYTVSDGTATDTATLIFTVTGINDAPVAVNDTDTLNEDATVTRSSGSSLLTESSIRMMDLSSAFAISR